MRGKYCFEACPTTKQLTKKDDAFSVIQSVSQSVSHRRPVSERANSNGYGAALSRGCHGMCEAWLFISLTASRASGPVQLDETSHASLLRRARHAPHKPVCVNQPLRGFWHRWTARGSAASLPPAPCTPACAAGRGSGPRSSRRRSAG